MPSVPVYNQEGKEIDRVTLTDAVFGVPIKKSLVHQVYVAIMANARLSWAHTKGRGDVRGGGRKPWKQKGTGRARHGSIRSPLWKGGGVTFGPLSTRNYAQKINKKMSQLAVKMCLTDKVDDQKMIVVDAFSHGGKTKAAAGFLKKLPMGESRSMILLPARMEKTLVQSVQNIPGVEIRQAGDVNVVDLLHREYVVITKDGVMALEKRFESKKTQEKNDDGKLEIRNFGV